MILFFKILKDNFLTRIESYLNQPVKNGQTKEQQKEWIVEQLKKEIQNGVLTFLQTFTRKYEWREIRMNFEVVNRDICVGHINVLGVSSSSVLMVGDTNSIQLTSLFDTPPESLIIGPFVPLGTLMLTRISKVATLRSNQSFLPLLSKLVIQTKLMV